MVRIGPGGIVRAEGGKIVTTLGRLTGSTLTPLPRKKQAAAAAAARATSTITGLAPLPGTEEDDEDLSCALCMSSFWYKTELDEHMKNAHNAGGAKQQQDSKGGALKTK